MKKKWLISNWFSITVLCLSSCGGCEDYVLTKKPDGRDSKKKSLIIGIAQEPDTLFIPFQEMMAAEEVVRVGNYSLTYFDENWRIAPWAAKEIPTLENGLLEIFKEGGVEKMRTTWHIRDDFFWSDGQPLTADDFLFTNMLYNDKTQEVINRSIVDKIEKMASQGADKKTLVVTWKEPYAYYHNYRQHEALPKHILEPLYIKAPDQLKKSRFGQAPLLAGSFFIEEWVPGSHIIAKKNPHMKGEHAPGLDEIVWKIIPQTNTLESNLVSGTIDAISTTGLSLEQALQFETRHKDDFDFHYKEGLVWEHIAFNLDNPILADVRVRHALAYGCDREGIAKTLFNGRQPMAHGSEPPKSLYFNANIKKYPFDVAKAKSLLDQAGWVLLPDKTVREKNGQPLKLVIMTTSGNKSRERVEQFLQSQWRTLGVDVVIKNEPAKVFFGETVHKRKFPALAMFSWVKDPLTISDSLWLCENIPRAANSYQGQNITGFCSKKGDDLLKRATKELDEAKRIMLGQEFEALFAEELPSLPLFFHLDVSVTSKKLKNWKPTGTLQPVTWNAYQWSWI